MKMGCASVMYLHSSQILGEMPQYYDRKIHMQTMSRSRARHSSSWKHEWEETEGVMIYS